MKIIKLGVDGKRIPSAPTLPKDVPIKPKSIVLVTLDDLVVKSRVRRVKETGPNGHWEFDDQMGKSGYFGFIYLIEDLLHDRWYIGKKQYLGTGSKNKGVQTNWKDYTSSSDKLNTLIQLHGKENFKFFCLEQYHYKGTLGFAETWSLMMAETPANQGKWYNLLVNKVSWPCKEQISSKHKERLTALLQHKELPIWK